MTAREATAPSPGRHPLGRGATPEAIHAALLETDRSRFRAAFTDALDRAKQDLDLTPVFETLEDWRRLAVAQSDPNGWRHAVRRAAELATGAVPPEDEPLEVTRSTAGF
jgi:uncharacterized protein DUF6247